VALKVSLFMTQSTRVSSDGRFHGTEFVSIATVSAHALHYWIILMNDILDLSLTGKSISSGNVAGVLISLRGKI